MGSPMVSLVWECDVIMSIVGYQYGEPYGQSYVGTNAEAEARGYILTHAPVQQDGKAHLH